MPYSATVHGERFSFADLTDLLAKANERKSGDELAGIAAVSERQRVAAKLALADVRISDFHDQPLVDDEVTAATRAAVAPAASETVASLTVGQLRELILAPQFPALWRTTLGDGFLPEVAAAVAKIMSDLDLVLAARPLRTITKCRNTMGDPGTLGGRLQPNHPTDDLAGILASVVDGLGYACGDAVIGVNPATDSAARTAQLLTGMNEFTAALEIPTQTCVLAHVTTQIAALEAGAPVDLLFQSLAGTEEANRSFGINLSLLQEARAEGAAKTLDPFLINTVVGFIGPEYLADSRQITRAGLEDHFCGKLLGLPMGVDVCYTNHVDADQNTNDDLLMLLTSAGCNYFMGLPGGVDVMLGYQSTSYHDVASMRRLSRTTPAPEFARWAESVGILVNGEIVGEGHGTTRAGRMVRLAEVIAARHAVPALGASR